MSLLLMGALMLVLFALALLRRLIHRTGRPRVLARRLGARTAGGDPAAMAVDELFALLTPTKHVRLEQQRTDMVLRHDAEDGAPPAMGLDLDAGRAVVRRPARTERADG
ncbi:DUF6191 domain-containing protein [Streptomyces sp. NPDC004788]